MSNITVKKVESKKDLMTFIKFQWKIYENYPNWVPPLIMERKGLLDKKKNPFFLHAEMDTYLAYKDGELVGRIAAIKNDLHNEVHNDKVGFFGFFESIEDQDVANKLLDTAKEWIKEKGLDTMRGPVNPSMNDETALLIEGFDDPPRIMMPYNPPYYKTLLENYGLQKAKDLFAFKIENEKMSSNDKIVRVGKMVQERYKMKLRELNLKDFANELNLFKDIYNKAWEPNWGFVPMTNEEIDKMAAEFKQIIDPTLVVFAEIDNKTIGFALVVPDYNYIFKEMNGKLFPFNFLKLFTKNKEIPWARIIVLGVLPEYQKKGLDAVLYHDILKRAAKRNIYKGEASWVLEDNTMMVRGAEMMNGTLYKKYRIFEIAV